MRKSSPKRGQRVSLSDLASKAEVSIATASRVISGAVDVSDELTQKVRKAMVEIGYVMPTSRTRKSKRPVTLGFLSQRPTTWVRENEFFQHFLHGVELEIQERQGHLLYASFDADLAARRLPAMVDQGLVAGVILKTESPVDRDWLLSLHKKIPVVLMNHSLSFGKISSIEDDTSEGVLSVLEYLRDLGHTRIGFLSILDVGHPVCVPHEERRRAFISHASHLGLAIPPGYIQCVERDETKEQPGEAISRAIDAWMAMGDNRPTAVFCPTDLYAMIFVTELRRRGLDVPRDFSVVGFMNTFGGEHFQPAITSVALASEETGRAAVDLIAFHIANPQASARQIKIAVPTRLIERLSCRAL